MNMYLSWRTLSELFDTPDECCKDWKMACYLSGKPDASDIITRRPRVYKSKFELRFQRDENSPEVVLENFDTYEAILEDIKTEMPHLGFCYPADVFTRDALKIIFDKFEGHGYSLDNQGYKYRVHIEVVKEEKVTAVFTVYKV